MHRFSLVISFDHNEGMNGSVSNSWLLFHLSLSYMTIRIPLDGLENMSRVALMKPMSTVMEGSSSLPHSTVFVTLLTCLPSPLDCEWEGHLLTTCSPSVFLWPVRGEAGPCPPGPITGAEGTVSWCRKGCRSNALSLCFTWCPHTLPAALTQVPSRVEADADGSEMLCPTTGKAWKDGSCIVIPFYRRGSQVTGKFNNLSWVTRLLSGRLGI